MTRDERDRDYWYILACAAFWVGVIWLAAEMWLEVIR